MSEDASLFHASRILSVEYLFPVSDTVQVRSLNKGKRYKYNQSPANSEIAGLYLIPDI
jgi:hypothetical protein